MAIITPIGFSPAGQPLEHARILHPGGFASGTASASSTDGDYDVTAPDNLLTFDKWFPSAAGECWWRLSFAGDTSVNCAAIAAHDVATEGATVRVQALVGGSWADQTTATTVTNDAPVMFLFPSVTASAMRIVFSAPCKVGVIRFGAAMEMTQPIYAGHVPSQGNRDTQFTSNLSASGEILGTVKRRTALNAGYQWDHIRSAWVRNNWYPMMKASEGQALFVAWRPASFGDVAYGVPTQFAAPSNMGIEDLMSVGFQMQAHSYD